MDSKRLQGLDFSKIKTPCFIVDEKALEENLKILSAVQKQSGIRILLALKAFSMYSVFPLISRHLYGICASGLNEARLGFEEFKKEVHTFSPAFSENEFSEISRCSNYIIFNSIAQWKKFKPIIQKNKKKIYAGLRLNPEHSVASRKFGVYDPCSKNSRLGITLDNLDEKELDGITGIHFHALCEQNADALEEVLDAFVKRFSHIIKKMEWVNFGGGHHITAKNYDRKKLKKLISDFKKQFPSINRIYMEPGEAIALNAGIFVSTVLDIVQNEKKTAILDSSVETHFPDILITKNEAEPYIPEIIGADLSGKYPYKYLLGGISCAAGDVFGEYSFKKPISIGQKIFFLDAAHYSMVKLSTFNGVELPTIYLLSKSGKLKLIKEFSYKDFKARL
ncbi:MAG: hypothetical protein ACD_79C00592G0006 [uncultured bacterium]|nr:MAG: hypothetical protein ACD_79C00592G0006 [uncultured bacterium]